MNLHFTLEPIKENLAELIIKSDTEVADLTGIPPLEKVNNCCVKFVACTNTMGTMGISEDAFIPEVDTFAGVPTYLVEAKESKINLFI